MKKSRIQFDCLLLVAFCFVATLCWTDAVSAQSGLSSRGGTSNAEDATATITSKKWSSFFSVDPSKILSILVNRGGLLLPNSVEKELAALANVVNVDEASLNLVERALVVKNFTVSIPGSSRESLRVGSVYITWDSYTRPCVDIQVEEVDTLVEFTNLMLTRSNWCVSTCTAELACTVMITGRVLCAVLILTLRFVCTHELGTNSRRLAFHQQWKSTTTNPLQAALLFE